MNDAQFTPSNDHPRNWQASGITPFPLPGWLVYRESDSTKEMNGKPIQWFAEQAETSFDTQASLSQDISALLKLASGSCEHGDVSAVLRAVEALVMKWDGEMCKLFVRHEELINKLHGSEAIAGEPS